MVVVALRARTAPAEEVRGVALFSRGFLLWVGLVAAYDVAEVFTPGHWLTNYRWSPAVSLVELVRFPGVILLWYLGYRLQSARKRQEGASHPDRNAQFEHINATADAFLAEGQPVISVDPKKKELVENFKNGGREWQPKGTPPAVLVHDFPTDAEGKAMPYGVYDMRATRPGGTRSSTGSSVTSRRTGAARR